MFEDINEQNAEAGSQYQTNSFNNGNSGGYNPDTSKYPGDNYASPWDIWFNRGALHVKNQPVYLFSNGNDENISPYTIYISAYVGLAYFDGDNNGIFEDPSTTPPTQFSINNGYPNLWDGTKEVGNLVKTNSFRLDPQESMRMEDNLDHLPVLLGGATTSPNPKSTQANFALGFQFPPTVQPLEVDFLRQYGKVFFYEVDVFEAGAFIGTYVLHPEIETLAGTAISDWRQVETTPGSGTQLSGITPAGNYSLFYYDNGTSIPTNWDLINPFNGNACNSHEVVFNAPLTLRTQAITGGSVTKSISIGVAQNPNTFWYNSALYLGVH